MELRKTKPTFWEIGRLLGNRLLGLFKVMTVTGLPLMYLEMACCLRVKPWNQTDLSSNSSYTTYSWGASYSYLGLYILTLKLGSIVASGKICDSLNFHVLFCKLKFPITAF